MNRALWLLVACLAFACSSDGKVAAGPKSKRPALTLATDLDGKALAPDATSRALLRLTVRAAKEDGTRRQGANIALVIDTSGSMAGAAIDDARTAARALVSSLAEGDRLAVIAFGSRAELLLPSTELDRAARQRALDAVSKLAARGTTDLAAGLELGLAEVTRHLTSEGVNRVLLLGDGVPNDVARAAAQAAPARASGVSITALGLGLDYDEALMGAIARETGGKFRHIADSAAVAEFLRDEVKRVEGVVGRAAALDLTPGPGVRVSDVVGQRFDRVEGKIHIDLGDVSRGDERTLFVELDATTRRAGSVAELGDVSLTWTEPGSGDRGEVSAFVSALSTADAAALAAGHDGDVELGAALARAAAATVRGVELARSGQAPEARRLLGDVATDLERLADLLHQPQLKEEASSLRALASDLPPPATPEAAPGAAAPTPAPRPAAAAARSMEQYQRAVDHFQ